VPITSGHASNVFYRCRLQALTNTSDIWGNYLPWGLTNAYRTHYSLESYQSLDSTFYMPTLTSDNEGVQITFTIDQVAKEYIISPTSLPDAIIKLGSLLGLLKLFILFSLANEWHFEKTLDARFLLGKGKGVSPTKDNEEPCWAVMDLTPTIPYRPSPKSPWVSGTCSVSPLSPRCTAASKKCGH